MSSPKHLWSADWERESQAPAPADAGSSDPPAPADEPNPTWSRRPSRRTLLGLGALLILLIAVGVTLASVFSSSSHTPGSVRTTAQALPGQSGGGGLFYPPTPQQPTPQAQVIPQQPSQAQIGPTYRWLGMQISDTPSGIAVATVNIGGAADRAGVNPGDIIETVNGTSIDSIAQLLAATAKLPIDKPFQLIVDRGTTAVIITPTLTNRPTRQP